MHAHTHTQARTRSTVLHPQARTTTKREKGGADGKKKLCGNLRRAGAAAEGRTRAVAIHVTYFPVEDGTCAVSARVVCARVKAQAGDWGVAETEWQRTVGRTGGVRVLVKVRGEVAERVNST